MLDWLKTIFADPKTVGGIVGGFMSAFLLFFFGEVLWKRWIAKIDNRLNFKKEQLNSLYAPLYEFYKTAYYRFDIWKAKNSNTVLHRQPFFEDVQEFDFVSRIIQQKSGYASHKLLSSWAEYRSAQDNDLKVAKRTSFVALIISGYHALLKDIGLDYNKKEMELKEFELQKDCIKP